MGKSTRSMGRRNGRADVIEFFSPAKQWWGFALVGMLVRLRCELVALVVVLVAWLWLRNLTGSGIWAVVILGGLLVVMIAEPHSRRFAAGRGWCVLDRHRLRACLRQTKVRTMNMDGALPLLLWARPTKTGERVWAWIRSGSSADDLDDALSYIAPACLAREARIHRVRKLTTIVAIEVIRRDPLGTPTPIASPLARFSKRLAGEHVIAEGTEPISAASVTDITTRMAEDAPVVDYPGTAQRRAAPKKTTPKNTSTATSAAPAVVVNGEDLSDYID